MDQLIKKSDELFSELNRAAKQIDLDKLESQLSELTARVTQPNFWNDVSLAQRISKQESEISLRVKPWRELIESVGEVRELAGVADESIAAELSEQLGRLNQKFDLLKQELRFSGKYDSREVILSIYAGAGGTDAQDWAQMLLRMYFRWAEKSGCKIETISESSGEEAGIKSVTAKLSNQPFLYGKLKGEHGVHRLVRLSPFNSDNLRQTSFAKVDILPVIDQPEELQISDKDLKIDVYRAGGHGGQSVNTTDSAVRVTHLPTGIAVAIQNERSQLQNKETAMTILRSKLAQLSLEQHQESLAHIKGPNEQAAWGNQIRSYVLHPYKQVKDSRSGFETSDPQSILDGNIDQMLISNLV